MKDQLKSFLKKFSILKGDFTLSSGEKSSYYIDARICSLSSEPLSIISSLFFKKIKELNINYVGGPTIGADPIVGAILNKAAHEKYSLNGFLVRSTEKGHGTKKTIEGPSTENKKVIIVEDVVSTGGSIKKAINNLENNGCEIIMVLSIVDREMGAIKMFKDTGIPYEPLFRISDLLEDWIFF